MACFVPLQVMAQLHRSTYRPLTQWHIHTRTDPSTTPQPPAAVIFIHPLSRELSLEASVSPPSQTIHQTAPTRSSFKSPTVCLTVANVTACMLMGPKRPREGIRVRAGGLGDSTEGPRYSTRLDRVSLACLEPAEKAKRACWRGSWSSRGGAAHAATVETGTRVALVFAYHKVQSVYYCG
jgi:hypothetical protein